MSKWFVVEPWAGRAAIKEVQVDRHTEVSVWIGGKRRNRLSQFERYFPTWEDAHANLMADAEEKLLVARRKLQEAQSRYGNIKGMKPPVGLATFSSAAPMVAALRELRQRAIDKGMELQDADEIIREASDGW